MAVFGVIFLFVALVLIGVGIAIGTFFSLLAFVLVALGVVSSSVFVGLRQCSGQAGIRMFLFLGALLAGIPAGMVAAWIGAAFLEVTGTHGAVLFYGGLGGAFSGIVLAALLDWICRKSARWVVRNFEGGRKLGAV